MPWFGKCTHPAPSGLLQPGAALVPGGQLQKHHICCTEGLSWLWTSFCCCSSWGGCLGQCRNSRCPPTCYRGNLAGKLVKTQGIKVNSSFVRSGSLCSLLTIPQSGAFRRSVYFLWSQSSCKGLGAGMPCCRRAQAWLHVGSVAEPGDGNFLF